MAMFKDVKGREWSVLFTIGLVRSIKDRLQLDLLDSKSLGNAIAEPYTRFDLLWLACETQAKSLGIDSAASFELELISATQDEAERTRVWKESQEALTSGLVDFFLRSGMTDLHQMMNATIETVRRTREATTRRLSSEQLESTILKAEKMAEKAMDEAIAKANTQLDQLGNVSGS